MRVFAGLLFLFLTSCSTSSKVIGTYFSANQDCLSLDQERGLIEAKEIGILDGHKVIQSKNKLKFFLVSRRPFPFKRRYDKYYFRWLEKKGDSVMIAPISKKADTFFHNKRYIIFTTKEHFADPTNYFTKIVFHSGRCFGACDDLHLQLDYSGNLKVTNNGNTRTDSTRNDNYYGKISYEDLYRLRIILQNSRLKTLEWPNPRIIQTFDAGDITLILYQYEKHYYFRQDAASVPLVSWELVGFLRSLFTYPTLHKVDTTFTYEK